MGVYTALGVFVTFLFIGTESPEAKNRKSDSLHLMEVPF